MFLVTGATGFIGKHLMQTFKSSANARVRALTRKPMPSENTDRVEYVLGDLTDVQTLRTFLVPGATLINLAFSNTLSEHDAIATAILMANTCADVGVKRLIHCSSISVYGRVNGFITESTPCAPHDAYGQIKLATEQALIKHARGKFELIILRPSEVFGYGGKTLMALLQSLSKGNSLVNYTRSSLFGKRRTHLVPVETLVETIQFFCTDERQYDAEIFNVTADDQPLNQFHHLEQVLRQELELPDYCLPVLPVPSFVLKSILLLSKRATIDQQVLYSSEKLIKNGFNTSFNLATALRKLAHTYRDNKAIRTIT
jgi:nucleoside-diphosphate-sugar epimerase